MRPGADGLTGRGGGSAAANTPLSSIAAISLAVLVPAAHRADRRVPGPGINVQFLDPDGFFTGTWTP